MYGLEKSNEKKAPIYIFYDLDIWMSSKDFRVAP